MKGIQFLLKNIMVIPITVMIPIMIFIGIPGTRGGDYSWDFILGTPGDIITTILLVIGGIMIIILIGITPVTFTRTTGTFKEGPSIGDPSIRELVILKGQ